MSKKHKMKKVEPIQDWVALRKVGGDRTASGLLIPENAQEEVAALVVVAVGPGYWDFGTFVKTQLKVGDVVQHNPNAQCVKSTRSGEELYYTRERDLVAVIVGRETNLGLVQ
jgi:co-chaperonin GroES (HSP10)